MAKPPVRRDPIDELARMLRTFRRDQWVDVTFNDWVELTACCFANVATGSAHPLYAEREKCRQQISKRYSPEQMKEGFGKMLELLVTALTENCGRDVFAELTAKLELPKRHTQTFTPWEIAAVQAKLTLGSKQEIETVMYPHGFVTIHDPACGSGVMLLAAARHMLDEGINYQQSLHATAVDIDLRCVHMTYIQATIIGLPAIIVHGNTLALSEHSHWPTLFHVTGKWDERMQFAGKLDAMRAFIADHPINEPAEPPPAAEEQVELPTAEAEVLTPAKMWQPPVVSFHYPDE